MNLFFVFNPKAGKEKIKSKLGDIIELFSVAGNKITIAATTKHGDATDWVRDLPEGYDRVICSGGDGTLDEVVNGMAAREVKIPIGYIPAGSTNDFASSLGIPSATMAAARAAIGDHIFNCDVGTYNDKRFVYVAAFGAFTEVSYATPQDVKNRIGHAAYIIEGIKSLNTIKKYHMHVETEHMTIDDDFIYGMITNSDSVGGFKNITGKDVNLDDGLFEVTLIRDLKGPVEANAAVAALLDKNLSSKDVYTFKTDRIKFTADEEIPWTIDGEYAGSDKEVTVCNHRQELQICIK